MIILAGGDSFIWGSELVDSPHGGPAGWSKSTFTALLSKGHTYRCSAYPGLGNQEIADNVILGCEKGKPDVVLVCWTWPTRDNEVDSDKHIIKLQKYLEENNIPYMFTCADNSILTGALDYSNWFFFPPASEEWNTTTPRGFYQWAVENKYKCGTQEHPLEKAHVDASKLMQEKFDEMVKKFVQ